MKKNLSIGQGHGIAGRYGGLPDPYGSKEFSKIVLLPIPFDETTTYQKGSDKGPAALIEASRNMELYDIETRSEIYLNGIYTAPPVLAKSSEKMLEEAYHLAKSYFEKEKFLVTLGGEHTISYPSIKAAAHHFKELSIVQFDAHLDLQPAYEGNPWSHASVMARVKELPLIKQIVAVGIRSLASEELPSLDPSYTFFAHEMEERQEQLFKTFDHLQGPLYITFDLDAFDASLMPSTGTPEPGGLMWNQACHLLKYLFAHKRVVGFDIVELLPRPCNPAPDYLAAKLLYKMLSYQFAK